MPCLDHNFCLQIVILFEAGVLVNDLSEFLNVTEELSKDFLPSTEKQTALKIDLINPTSVSALNAKISYWLECLLPIQEQ